MVIATNDAVLFRYLADKRKDIIFEIEDVAKDHKTSDDDHYLTVLCAKLVLLNEIIKDLIEE